MPNPNALVGVIVAVNRSADGGVNVELEGGRSAHLVGDERAGGFFSLLEQLRKARKPVYLEVDPATGTVTHVRVPLVTRVQEFVTDAKGIVRVRLERSHALPGVRKDNPDYEEILRTLRDAKVRRELLALTTDGPYIIDVRPYPPPPDEPPRSVLEYPRPKLTIWEWHGWPWNWFRCVSKRRAQQLFDLCATQTCDPLTVPMPCIPFNHPEDGCWARASEMCRLMILDGVTPRKVWIDGILRADTRNSPFCEVYWGWHVAMTICVRKFWFFITQEQVIDPSLFTTPVSKATWKSVQNDPAATLTSTDHTYYASWHPADPMYMETNSDLAYYRMVLQARALGPDGPPPYAHCP